MVISSVLFKGHSMDHNLVHDEWECVCGFSPCLVKPCSVMLCVCVSVKLAEWSKRYNEYSFHFLADSNCLGVDSGWGHYVGFPWWPQQWASCLDNLLRLPIKNMISVPQKFSFFGWMTSVLHTVLLHWGNEAFVERSYLRGSADVVGTMYMYNKCPL